MLTYSPWAFYAVLAAVVAQLVPLLNSVSLHDVAAAVDVSKSHVTTLWPLYVSVAMLVILLVNHRSTNVYLVDFACADPHTSWRVSHDGT